MKRLVDYLPVLVVIVVVSCFGLICAATVFIPVAEIANQEVVAGQVQDMYIKRVGESDYFHVVVQKNDDTVEIFQNRDKLLMGKVNSADVQQALDEGLCYQFKVIGWRVPLFSMFRNIVEYTEVPCN